MVRSDFSCFLPTDCLIIAKVRIRLQDTIDSSDDSQLDRIRQDIGSVLRRVAGQKVRVEEVAPFGSGHSGFTYSVETGSESLVLRLSPPAARIAGPADIGRQGRIMSALHAAGFVVPRVLAFSSEPAIDGRSFVLMERVDGLEWPEAVAEHGGATVARAAAEALAALQAIPVPATGIGSESPIEPIAEIDRWSQLLERAPEDEHGPGRALSRHLRARTMRACQPTLVHGDYHYANLLFAEGAVVAVVDWEIAEIGQPLMDVASLTVTALRARYAPDPNPSGNLGISPGEIAAFAAATEDEINWYTALGCLKYAAILGYNLHLHRAGRRVDPIYESLLNTIHGLLVDGMQILEDGFQSVPLPEELRV